MNKQTGITKGQYKSFKDQIDVNYNNRENGVKKEDAKIIDNVPYSYICQGGLNKKEIQLSLCNIFFIFIFNELFLFA